ncbi:MAG TPA: hypothetical protein DCR55_17535 [Lentisphaeria bacterium]|nr:hypothetical protein [Lentisphaeria bacterium]
MVLPEYSKYLRAKADLGKTEALLLEAREDHEHLASEIALLESDPYTVERIAREKFNWRRVGEEVYEFEN